MKVPLALAGLVAVAASLVLAFQNPYGLWHWLLLLVAFGCLVASRRLR